MFEEYEPFQEETFFEGIMRRGFAWHDGMCFFKIRAAAFWIKCSIPNSDNDVIIHIEKDIKRYVEEGVVSQVNPKSFGEFPCGEYSESALLTEKAIRELVAKKFIGLSLPELSSFVIFAAINGEAVHSISIPSVNLKNDNAGGAKDFVAAALKAYEHKFKGEPKPTSLAQLLGFAQGDDKPIGGYTIKVEGKGNNKRVYLGVGVGSVTYRAVAKAFKALMTNKVNQ